MTVEQKAAVAWDQVAPGIRQYYGIDDGACEGWTFRKRAQVLEETEKRVIASYFRANPGASPYSWQGKYTTGTELSWSGSEWANNVNRYSADLFPVDGTPTVGALVVWNSNGAEHIAYVEQVNDDGSFEVSQMSAAEPHKVTNGHIPQSTIARYNLQFIH
jgi:hypothetical protein